MFARQFFHRVDPTKLTHKTSVAVVLLAMFWIGQQHTIHAQTSGPDVIVGDLQSTLSYGSDLGISAFAVGTTSCNIGDEELLWISATEEHPVIGQNMYRIEDGILQQIGQSWLKHGFFALSLDLCSPGQCVATAGASLGVGCSDPYSANLNGTISGLGPRSQVNPSTGDFPYPFSAPAPTNTTISRRVQVLNSDLQESAANSALSYFVEAQYVAADDTLAGNGSNNVSNREVDVSINGLVFELSFIPGEETQREQTAIERWAAEDSTVQLESLDIVGDGRIQLASKVIDLGGGFFHYEYAIYNQTSDEAVGALQIPLPAGLAFSSIESYHVRHHSSEPLAGYAIGETYSNDSWSATSSATNLRWNTAPSSGPWTAANPIRWGTMANFRFVTDAPPVAGLVDIDTWKTEQSHAILAQVPLGGFVPAVQELSCNHDLIDNMVHLNWQNGASYTSIELTRNGLPLATLSGDSTSYSEAYTSPTGILNYELSAISSSGPTVPIACEVTIPAGPITYLLSAEDSTLQYTPSSGAGFGAVAIHLIEDPDNLNYPNGIDGLSFALSYDPSLLQASAVQMGSALSDIDFFEANILAEGGTLTGGITVGAVISFDLNTQLLADGWQELVICQFQTVPSALIGNNVGMQSTLIFEDAVHGAIPVSGVIATNLQSLNPVYRHAQLQLVGDLTGPLFIRGDVNGDGVIQISDAIGALGHLFTGILLPCEKALDSNDDGDANIADVIYILNYQFSGGPVMPAPFPTCGIDSTPDILSCPSGTSCP